MIETDSTQKEGMLGIIGCCSLSEQILHLIDRDEDIDNLFVVKNLEGMRFVEKIRDQFVERNLCIVDEDQLPQRKWRGFSVILWLNPEDLHNDPSALQHAQSQILSKMSAYIDSALFCYGLCRSSEQRINSMIKQARIPITFLTDSNGETVDDCFAAILGGKKTYLDCILRHKGTLLASAGYEEAWRRKFREMDIETIFHEAKWLKHTLEALGYNHILILDDGLGDRDQFEKDVRTYAQVFDLEVTTRKCGLEVFERSYDMAKLKIEVGGILQPDGIMAEELGLSVTFQSEWFTKW